MVAKRQDKEILEFLQEGLAEGAGGRGRARRSGVVCRLCWGGWWGSLTGEGAQAWPK